MGSIGVGDDVAGRVLDAAERLAAAGGPRAVAVRAVAADAGCSVGMVYKAVGDLGRVALGVNARTLGRLGDAIAAVPADRGVESLCAMARAYLAFVAANPGLWRMVIDDEGAAAGIPRPPAIAGALSRMVAAVDGAMRPLVPEAAERTACVATLWASLQGIASLAAGGKLAVVGDVDPAAMADRLVRRFLSGRG